MRQGSTRLGLTVVLVLSAIPALARGGDDEPPLPDSQLGHRMTPLLLLSRADVRTDLALTADQAESARKAIRTFYVQARALRGRPDTPETIRERRAVDEEALRWIDSRLTPDQKLRLIQVDLQWEGPAALISRPLLTRDLHLSEDQVATMATAVHRRNQLRAKGEEKADQILMEVAIACLNETQLASWRGMLGRPFTPQLAQRAVAKTTR
jgi:hypothetical protein